ncbi:HesB/IscA family protein [Buchnera aphidicola]|uniref:Protein SufA n=1 Tax=Buchnera aphidicola subsp. Tuberolachnus salignus TaxID=98804 RepID=A0A170PBJ9_BUCTT|nr:iron-sulfur cluster assembly accessory protein [Buchnera aphidicola]CUR53063.1 Protein SufA [Buchnera aphidicola (Tuberolachnus salignus)]
MNIQLIKKKKYKINLTKNAKKQILYLLNKNNNLHGIKITIKKTGCAGFKYILKLVLKNTTNDIQILQDKIIFYIPKQWISKIQNITIDYSSKGLNSNFIFNNPKNKNYCGCGESFQI